MSIETMSKSETQAGATDYAHMLMKVSDIARSERFYVDLLGFKIRPAKPLADGRPFVPFTQGLALTNGGTKNSPQIDHIALRRRMCARSRHACGPPM
jgi:ureidoacrylate peracid hydrolase